MHHKTCLVVIFLVLAGCTSRTKETIKEQYVITDIICDRIDSTDKQPTREDLQGFVIGTRDTEIEKEEDEKTLKMINDLALDPVKREAIRTKAMSEMAIEDDLKFHKDMDDRWFDQMINGATASQETPIAVKDRDGNDLQIQITNVVIEYMIANRFMILKVGKDIFKQFLLLCSNGQDLAALKLIYSNMDTAALINQYRENAIKLAEIYKQDQETKAFWLQMATTLGGKLISLALGSLI